MPKFKVTLTRLVEQEATVYVDAPSNDDACDTAMDWAVGEQMQVAWHEGDGEPHSLIVEAERSELVDRRMPKADPDTKARQWMRDASGTETVREMEWKDWPPNE